MTIANALREPDDEGRAWREKWIANVQALARQQVPTWLRDLRKEPLKPQATTATIANPSTPLPQSQQDTGPIAISTQMIPIVKLLPIDVRDTRELVSEAVRWFFDRHGVLPIAVALGPLRYLAICSRDYFPVDCEEIGCYTVSIEQEATLAGDVVECRGRLHVWGKEVRDWYL